MSQLRAGTVLYWPKTNDVSVRLNISDANTGQGKAVSNSDSIYVSRPAEGSVGPLPQPKTADSRYQRIKAGGPTTQDCIRSTETREQVRKSYFTDLAPDSSICKGSACGAARRDFTIAANRTKTDATGSDKPMVPKAAVESFSTVTFEAVHGIAFQRCDGQGAIAAKAAPAG